MFFLTYLALLALLFVNLATFFIVSDSDPISLFFTS